MKITKLVLAACLLSISTVYATTVSDFQVMNLRQRSMGGVGTAVMFDEMALMSNPAGLAYSKFDIDWFNASIAAGQESIDKLQDIVDLKDKKDDTAAIAQQIKSLVPLNVDMVQTFAPLVSLTAPGFGVGVFSQTQLHGQLLRKTAPKLSLEARSDIAPSVGVAHEFNIWGPTAIGFSVKVPTRVSLYDKESGSGTFELELIDMQNLIADNSNKKEPGVMALQGIAFDFGVLRPFDSYKYGKGYYGLSVRNIGGSLTGDQELTSNGVTHTKTYTEELPIVSSVGFSYMAPLGNIPRVGPLLGDILIAADWNFISPETDYKKDLHIGIEKKLWIFRFRGGINQGYVVGGAGLDLKFWIFNIIHLDYANYSEELGSNVGDRPAQYQALELQLLF